MRRLLNLLTALSLLLCVAVGVLWVRSYWVFDQVLQASGRHYRNVTSLRGRVSVQLVRVSQPVWYGVWHRGAKPAAGMREGPLVWQFAGFGKGHGKMMMVGVTGTEGIYVFPYWALLVTFAAPGVLRWIAARRRRRLRERERLCPSCGYDLRATPDRCPECGYSPIGVRAFRLLL